MKALADKELKFIFQSQNFFIMKKKIKKNLNDFNTSKINAKMKKKIKGGVLIIEDLIQG